MIYTFLGIKFICYLNSFLDYKFSVRIRIQDILNQILVIFVESYIS